MAKFSKEDIIFIQKKMIRMLKNKRKFGGAHTETVHLRNCVPKHLRGEKIVDTAIKDLFDEGILINKQSTGEKHCSLNNAKLKEIEDIETS
ncbi:hypothetical protein KY347_05385 [Candidatus Woesearchaeota archaeon]|nr:hypothetical protein [Candidatus Woesearchaeota archaeon]